MKKLQPEQEKGPELLFYMRVMGIANEMEEVIKQGSCKNIREVIDAALEMAGCNKEK